MAISTLFGKGLCVIVLCFIFVGLLSAQENNQYPRDSTIDGQGSTFFFYQEPALPRDCSEVRDSCSASVSSGVNLIKPDGYNEPFESYCDNDFESGSWTVILRRLDGSVNFKRNWSEYKKGFGFLSTEFWLGNDKLSYLTNQAQYEVRIDITLDNGTSCDVSYNTFRISDEWSDYTITSAGTYHTNEACIFEEGDINRPTDGSTSFTDCNDVYSAGNRQDGVYSIRPAGWNASPFDVFCNMSIDGGNWTVIQRRVDGSTDFYQNWTSYKDGFGNIEHEFWLGNEKLYYLTKQAPYEYRVDLVESSSSWYHKYSSFRIDNELNNYRVTEVGTLTGTRGDSLKNNLNIAFSTYDQDNDGRSQNCAEGHHSGWWHGGWYSSYSYSRCYHFRSGKMYVHCSADNPNGDFNGSNGNNMYFDTCYAKFSEIKIRRIS